MGDELDAWARLRRGKILLGCYVDREAAMDAARAAGGLVTRDTRYLVYEVWCDARDAPDELPF